MDLFALHSATQDLRGNLAQARIEVQALPITLREDIDTLWEQLSSAFNVAALAKQQLQGQIVHLRLQSKSQQSSNEAAKQVGRAVSKPTLPMMFTM